MRQANNKARVPEVAEEIIQLHQEKHHRLPQKPSDWFEDEMKNPL